MNDTTNLETKIVPLHDDIKACKALEQLVKLRTMSADDFIEHHASGTLRKNKRIGMAWHNQYLIERVAYEFGYGFECQPATRVLVGKAITEGDCHPVTEAGWHIERYQNTRPFPEDIVVPRYIHVTPAEGKPYEGLGMVLAQTSAPWIPKCHMVYAIIAEYDTIARTWKPAKNPA